MLFYTKVYTVLPWDCRCSDRMVVDLPLPMQSLPITTKVVSSNPAQGEMYSMQPYVIQFVRDLRQVGGFRRVLVATI